MADPLPKILGARFRLARKEAKVSLKTMAEKCGCCIDTIRRHEIGIQPIRVDLLVRAARVMRADPRDLILTERAGK